MVHSEWLAAVASSTAHASAAASETPLKKVMKNRPTSARFARAGRIPRVSSSMPSPRSERLAGLPRHAKVGLTTLEVAEERLKHLLRATGLSRYAPTPAHGGCRVATTHGGHQLLLGARGCLRRSSLLRGGLRRCEHLLRDLLDLTTLLELVSELSNLRDQIGRASCRERAYIATIAGA